MIAPMIIGLVGFALGGLCGAAIGITACMVTLDRSLQGIPSENEHYRTE